MTELKGLNKTTAETRQRKNKLIRLSRQITKNKGRKLYIEQIDDDEKVKLEELVNQQKVVQPSGNTERMRIRQKPMLTTRESLAKVVQEE